MTSEENSQQEQQNSNQLKHASAHPAHPNDFVFALASNQEGSLVASCSYGGTIQILERTSKNKQQLSNFFAASSCSSQPIFKRRGELFSAAGARGEDENHFSCLEFSPSSKKLAVGASENCCFVFDTEKAPNSKNSSASAASSSIFSPQRGRSLASSFFAQRNVESNKGVTCSCYCKRRSEEEIEMLRTSILTHAPQTRNRWGRVLPIAAANLFQSAVTSVVWLSEKVLAASCDDRITFFDTSVDSGGKAKHFGALDEIVAGDAVYNTSKYHSSENNSLSSSLSYTNNNTVQENKNFLSFIHDMSLSRPRHFPNEFSVEELSEYNQDNNSFSQQQKFSFLGFDNSFISNRLLCYVVGVFHTEDIKQGKCFNYVKYNFNNYHNNSGSNCCCKYFVVVHDIDNQKTIKIFEVPEVIPEECIQEHQLQDSVHKQYDMNVVARFPTNDVTTIITHQQRFEISMIRVFNSLTGIQKHCYTLCPTPVITPISTTSFGKNKKNNNDNVSNTENNNSDENENENEKEEQEQMLEQRKMQCLRYANIPVSAEYAEIQRSLQTSPKREQKYLVSGVNLLFKNPNSLSFANNGKIMLVSNFRFMYVVCTRTGEYVAEPIDMLADTCGLGGISFFQKFRQNYDYFPVCGIFVPSLLPGDDDDDDSDVKNEEEEEEEEEGMMMKTLQLKRKFEQPFILAAQQSDDMDSGMSDHHNNRQIHFFETKTICEKTWQSKKCIFLIDCFSNKHNWKEMLSIWFVKRNICDFLF